MFSSNSSQVSSAANYIEDVFSTWLYTGNGSTQTITNNIDLSTKGGLVWIKDRTDTPYHVLTDTTRGVNSQLYTNSNANANSNTSGVTAFNSNGFNIGSWTFVNTTSDNLVSWTFREQPKFFDVVTYTGTGTAHAINHNLGSVPGFIIVKSTSVAGSWYSYHRGTNGGVNPQNYGMNLMSTAAQLAYINFWNNTAPTATQFTVGDAGGETNETGVSYIAYLFAHDAGGFGLTGTDNVISCGSYTGVGSTQQDITLGYEPQWVMIKRTDTTNSWIMVDNMRGFFQTADNALEANTASAEAAGVSVSGAMQPTATGFHLYNANSAVNASGGTYIYIAIRRGPMKVPTLGTTVYKAQIRTGNGAAVTINGAGFPPDLILSTTTDTTVGPWFIDKLRGINQGLTSATTAAEATDAGNVTGFSNIGFSAGSGAQGWTNGATYNYVYQFFQRAPGFFDEVCYTADSVNGRTINHNLTVVPEFTIFKSRSATSQWYIWHSAFTLSEEIYFNTGAISAGGIFTSAPTSSAVFVKSSNINYSGFGNMVGYLFATCAGVSKVGSYTGNGTTQTINCGFTGGARFVLIKRTDSTGDWYVYDTARGMTVLTDPYLLLNSQAAEVATLGSVTTVSTGFALDSAILAAINVNAGSYIFLAIA